MNMRRRIGAIMTAGLLAGCQGATREPQVAAPTGPATPAQSQPARQDHGGTAGLPAEVAATLGQLASDDGTQTREILARLAATMAQNQQDAALLRQMTAAMQEVVARQTAELLSVRDQEARARIAGVLDFNEACTRFLCEVLAQREPTRGRLLAWGLSPAGAAVVGRVYSRREEQRAEGVRDLGQSAAPEADGLLARLILDDDRAVSLAAMDAVWDRTPTAEVVDALWDKAVDSGLEPYGLGAAGPAGPQAQARREARWITVHGRAVQLYNFYPGQTSRMADANVATEVLVAYDSPLVRQKLEALFTRLAELKVDRYRGQSASVLSPNFGILASNLQRLVDVYRPRSAADYLAKIVLGPTQDGWDNQMGQQVFRYSSRIDALGTLLWLTGQDQAEYGLRKRREFGNRWGIAGKEAEEAQAIKKFEAWWKKNGATIDLKGPPLPRSENGADGSQDFSGPMQQILRGG